MGKTIPVKHGIVDRETKKKLKRNGDGREYYICKNCGKVNVIKKYVYFRMMLDYVEQPCTCGQHIIFYKAKMWYI